MFSNNLNVFICFFLSHVLVWIVSKVSPESIPENLQPFAGQPQQGYPQPYPQQPVPTNAVPVPTEAPHPTQN